MSFDVDTRINTILNDRYRILKQIGSGGMGVVYLGERLELDKKVAVKFLLEVLASNENLLDGFRKEAKAMSKLSHPFCVSVIDFGVDGGPYIVMDYVEGITLKEALAKERFISRRAMKLSSQILSGLAHAHSQGIIHRDIKPANVMLCTSEGIGEHARVFDFGVAKVLSPGKISHKDDILADALLGTPSYMSPEQATGESVDAPSDLYSAGLTIFEMLTGKKAFDGENPKEIMVMQLNSAAPFLNKTDPKTSYSPDLERVIGKALEKNPNDRFQTAAEFLEALHTTPEGADSLCEVPHKVCLSPKNCKRGTRSK